LIIDWRSSRDAQESVGGRFLPERTRDAFATLNESLKDERLLESLGEVEIDFRPIYVPAGDMEAGRAKDFQKGIQSEVLEVLHGTIERVDTFSVTTLSSAFK
jgi:hypothetical protein